MSTDEQSRLEDSEEGVQRCRVDMRKVSDLFGPLTVTTQPFSNSELGALMPETARRMEEYQQKLCFEENTDWDKVVDDYLKELSRA